MFPLTVRWFYSGLLMTTLAQRSCVGIDPRTCRTVCKLSGQHDAAVNIVRFWGEHRFVTGDETVLLPLG
jgi:hypothetical protein